MKVTLVVLAVGFVSYVLWIALQFGIRKSISESYYVLQKSNHGYYFTAFMWFIMSCLIALVYFIEEAHMGISGSSHTWTIFLAACGAGFTGAATTYLKKMTRMVHFIGAASLILFSLLGLGLMFGNWIPLYGLAMVSMVLLFWREGLSISNVFYWFEVTAFIIIITGFFSVGW